MRAHRTEGFLEEVAGRRGGTGGLPGRGGLAQRWHRRASWRRWLGPEVVQEGFLEEMAQEGFLEEVAWHRGGAGGLPEGGGLTQRWHRRASWTRWLGAEVAQEGFLEEVAWHRGGAGGRPRSNENTAQRGGPGASRDRHPRQSLDLRAPPTAHRLAGNAPAGPCMPRCTTRRSRK